MIVEIMMGSEMMSVVGLEPELTFAVSLDPVVEPAKRSEDSFSYSIVIFKILTKPQTIHLLNQRKTEG